MTKIDEFFAFINKRHDIWHKKEILKQHPPWTNDLILQTYKFTNVQREQDRVTKWVKKHIRNPYASNPNLWFMLCIARQINWPDTLQELIDEGAWPVKCWQPDKVAKILLARKARKEKIWTGAYVIWSEGSKAVHWRHWDKNEYMPKIIFQMLWRDRQKLEPIMHTTVQKMTETLATYRGWGPFMAYQVAVDLTWTRYLSNASDVNTWCTLGPGSHRGLNRIHGRHLNAPLSQSKGLKEMQDLWSIQQRHLKDKLVLRLNDIEHSICEFDKYERARLGEGTPRSKYIYAK